MSKTLTAGTALSLVGVRFPRILQDQSGARLADEVQSYIWQRYPWRDSLIDLPPFHLLVEEPDYGPPLYAVPANFYGLHQAWIREAYGRTYPPLVVTKDLGISIGVGLPESIAYQPERASFRVHPRPSVTAPDFWIEGVYKKTITKITNQNVNSYILPFDDMYFPVFRKGLVWKFKEDILGDPSALNDFQIFENMLRQMAIAEGLHSGVVVVHPAENLELGGF